MRRKPQLFWPVFFREETDDLIDSFSLQPFSHPVYLDHARDRLDEGTYQFFALLNKQSPLSLKDLPDIKEDSFKFDIDLEIKSGSLKFGCLIPDHEKLEEYHLGELATLLAPTKIKIEQKPINTKVHSFVFSQRNMEWLKEYQTEVTLDSAETLILKAESHLGNYFASYPHKPNVFVDAHLLMQELNQSVVCLAQACTKRVKNQDLVISFACLLEEIYWAEQLFNAQKRDGISAEHSQRAGLDTQATNCALQDEIYAICQLHGFPGRPAPAIQLKAIDQEYKSLIANGQSSRADYIQTLFMWKSKQISQEGATAIAVSSHESPLGQAFCQFLEALSLNQSNARANFHVGRLLIMQGEYKSASERLMTCLHYDPSHLEARFLLGFSLGQEVLHDHNKEEASFRDATQLLTEGAVNFYKILVSRENAFNDKCNEFKEPQSSFDRLVSNDFFSRRNPIILQGLSTLGQLLQRSGQMIKAMNYYMMSIMYCMQSLPYLKIDSPLVQSILRVAIIGHANLIEIMLQIKEFQPLSEHVLQSRCRGFIALLQASNLEKDEIISRMHKKVAQVYAFHFPNDIVALANVGLSLLEEAQNKTSSLDKKLSSDAEEIIDEAIELMEAALQLVGKKSGGGEPTPTMTKHAWWKQFEKPSPVEIPSKTKADQSNKVKAEQSKVKAAAVKGGQKPAQKTAKPVVIAGKSEEKNISSKSRKAPYGELNEASSSALAGLANAYRMKKEVVKASQYFEELIKLRPNVQENYIEYAEMLNMECDKMSAIAVYCKVPSSGDEFSDAFIYGQIVDGLFKCEAYEDKRLPIFMVKWAKVYGMGILDKYISKLEEKGKTEICKLVYSGYHGKSMDDASLQDYFKMKFWT
ncbi:hypothetical protein Ciccas_001736 [Cichlidogyrus casuarinus]|uniref:Tetratricopeptide repeat protein n=1 Tax=Cichlidogyrus casuarinus TaxID=1844966 RepID=A0ABD2QJ60_9PLAT